MTISLDEALKAIQEFIGTKRGQELNSLVIVASTTMLSPSVRSFNSHKNYETFNTTSLGKLYEVPVVNPSWFPKEYELRLFPLPVVEPEKEEPKTLAFQHQFNVGHKFRVVNRYHKYFNNFPSPIRLGDILVIRQVDRTNVTQPYQCFLEENPEVSSWCGLNQFQDLIESGSAVFIPEVISKQSEKPEVPFHKRYKVGDQFKVVNASSNFLGGFDTYVYVGDTLTITSIDIYNSRCPYKVCIDKGGPSDYNWVVDYEFEQCVDSGDVVFIDSSWEEIPFHQKFSVGNQFVVKRNDDSCFTWFRLTPNVGDILTIVEVDRETTANMPYKLSPNQNPEHPTWFCPGCFQRVVEKGYVVLLEETETYESVTLGGITYNLVPK